MGNETKTAGDIPNIQSVSEPQTLSTGETKASIHAQNVVDANGIQEVFAVIKPPNYSSGSPDNPVTDLPTINLTPVGGNNYSVTYSGFTSEGVYNVTIFARDRKAVLSLPYQTSVTVESSSLPQSPECGGDNVTISNTEFGADARYKCKFTQSITLGDGVKVKQGATMIFRIEK